MSVMKYECNVEALIKNSTTSRIFYHELGHHLYRKLLQDCYNTINDKK